MKQIVTVYILLLAFCSEAQIKARLSPLTKIYLLHTERNREQLPENYVYRSIGDQVYIAALLKVSSALDPEQLEDIGVKTGTRAGNIWSALIPAGKVEILSTLSGIDYIQLDEPIHTMLDETRIVTRTDSVHKGFGGLPMPFHGDGVVTGIIDAGFDYRHPTLFDSTGTRYRVRKIWEQANPGNPPPAYSYGNEITDTLSMWNKGNDLPISHGAHVSGIAAGSGYGSPANHLYRGMADAADLVLVGITPPASDWTSTGMSAVIDALNYIYSYASSVGKPAIANLSWGCTIGPHDGLSLFSQACDNLTGSGKIFALSAGNNGGNNIHVRKIFSSADTMLRTFVTFNSSLGAKKTWVDIWGDSARNFCVQISLYNGITRTDSTGYICLDDLTHPVYLVNSNNDTFYATIVTAASEFNGKPRVFLDIHNKRPESVMLSVKATDGTVNIWSGFVQNTTGYYANFIGNTILGAVAGDNNMTIGDMATTQSALTVGAFISKTSFTNVSGNLVSYAQPAANGNIAPFSSKGPAADGRVKPDITAPGMVIGSSVNSFDPDYAATGADYSSVACEWMDPANGRNYPYAMLMGTSMSSPVASGVVALMLQANPSLTPKLVQEALAQTAITDIQTGVIPSGGSNTWGFGKINALAAVKRAMVISGTENLHQEKSTIHIYPNPGKEHISLTLISERSSTALLSVTDITGRKMKHEKTILNNGKNEITMYTNGWSSGVYFITIHTDQQTFTSKFILK